MDNKCILCVTYSKIVQLVDDEGLAPRPRPRPRPLLIEQSDEGLALLIEQSASMRNIKDSQSLYHLLYVVYSAGELSGQGHPMFFLCNNCKSAIEVIVK